MCCAALLSYWTSAERVVVVGVGSLPSSPLPTILLPNGLQWFHHQQPITGFILDPPTSNPSLQTAVGKFEGQICGMHVRMHARTRKHTHTPQQWEGTILQLHHDSFQHRHHGGDVQQDQGDRLQNTIKRLRGGSDHCL